MIITFQLNLIYVIAIYRCVRPQCYIHFRLGSSDRHAIAKTERNVGKGARAARIQRSKMVFVTVSLFLLSLVRSVFVSRVAD